ncbi:MAG: DUF4065 domain-containing protein, partial [Pseudomonadales bacterium]
VANFLLDHSDQVWRPVSHLALQKIIYFCHAWHLSKYREPLLSEEAEAWSHGPVFRSVYRSFKNCGSSHIISRAKTIDYGSGSEGVVQYEFPIEVETFLKNVFDMYARYSASDLRRISHERDGPWFRVWQAASIGATPSMKISDTLILQCFKGMPVVPVEN